MFLTDSSLGCQLDKSFESNITVCEKFVSTPNVGYVNYFMTIASEAKNDSMHLVLHTTQELLK